MAAPDTERLECYDLPQSTTSAQVGTATAAYWFQFFLDAGIPPADAGNYAVTFTENRIQQDMIVDLTKEYLHEMGVTVLGDTIAILKHAKRVHTQATREKVLNGSGLSSTTMATGSSSRLLSGMAGKFNVPAKVSAPVRPSRPSTEHIAEQLNKTASQTTPKPVAAQAKPDSLSKKYESQTMSAAAAAKDVQAPTKKRLHKVQDVQGIEPTPTTTAKGSVVRLKPKIVHEVPVPKVRNVTQEQEGGYKIIFPSGMIKKTKATATQLKQTSTTARADPKPSSVFDRLGQELTVDKETKTSARLLVTGTNQVETVDKGKATKGSTVFCRLGEKRELKRPATENDVDNVETKKKAKITVEDRLGPAKATMSPSASAGILSHNNMPDARPVHLRLGNKSVLPTGVGEDNSTVTGTSCPLNSGRIKTRSHLAEPTNTTSWSDSAERMATRCQKISFNSDAFTSNTGLTKRVGPQQLKDDLVIHVESQNSGGAVVRRIGSQKLTSGATQPTSNKSGNVMNRLGHKKSEGQAAQPNDKSSNVMLRLGSRRASEDHVVQAKPQNPVEVTVRIGSLKMMTSAAEDSSWTVPAASKTGVFGRLGNRTSSAAV